MVANRLGSAKLAAFWCFLVGPLRWKEVSPHLVLFASDSELLQNAAWFRH